MKKQNKIFIILGMLLLIVIPISINSAVNKHVEETKKTTTEHYTYHTT